MLHYFCAYKVCCLILEIKTYQIVKNIYPPSRLQILQLSKLNFDGFIRNIYFPRGLSRACNWIFQQVRFLDAILLLRMLSSLGFFRALIWISQFGYFRFMTYTQILEISFNPTLLIMVVTSSASIFGGILLIFASQVRSHHF